jgi:hypothetical protein
MIAQETIKVVGTNGQISLGKKYARRQVQISESSDGSLTIKLGKFIPDDERWLYRDGNLEKLRKAVRWSEAHEPRDNSDEIMEALERSINNG